MGRKSEGLADRLWPEKLQELQDTLSRSLGIPVLFVDPSGRPLAACEDLSEFCRRFTRAISFQRPCLECGRDDCLEEADASTMRAMRFRPAVHLCPLGVADAAVPIVSAGDTIGYLLSAQVNVDYGSDRRDSADRESSAREAEEHAALLSRLSTRSQQEMERVAAALSAAAWLVGALASARRRNVRLSERVREQSRWIQEHVVTDAVTGVANRRCLLQALKAEVVRVRRYKRNLSVAALDIEGFRQINDEFGHDVGDAVLRAVAQCLTSTLRQTDLVGRMGGDEFAVLMPETARHEAMIALARVSGHIEDLNSSGELPVEVRLAMGIVDDVADGREMLASAAEAARRTRGGALVD